MYNTYFYFWNACSSNVNNPCINIDRLMENLCFYTLPYACSAAITVNKSKTVDGFNM